MVTPQIIYQSIEHEKLSNFCEDTLGLAIMVCVVQWFEWIRPTKMTKIHNFSKIKRIRKIFSEYSSWRTILHFCFPEYHAITLPCYHMGSWYTTHMVPEWYYTKMGINRLEIDWRVIFEPISTKYSKWFHRNIFGYSRNDLLKMIKIRYFQIIIECDRLIHFSNSFQHYTQFFIGFRMVYNIIGLSTKW